MHFITLAAAASAAFAGVSAIAIPSKHVRVARRDKPATYAEGYLEKYQVYHERYLALDCESQHNTSFFDKCCHPMLATETLAKNRAPECNPANLASSTASSASPTGFQVSSSGSDDDDCDDENQDNSGDDDEDCDDEESTTAALPASTSVSTSHTAVPTTSTRSAAQTTSTHATSTRAPATSTKAATTHQSSSTHKASSTSSSKASTSTSTTSGGTFSGHATFFLQNGVAGACGKVHPDSAFLIALQTERYGDLSAQSPNCGRQIKLTNTKNGKSVVATVADACPTCTTGNDLDLSVGAFTQIATEEEGEVPITWAFVN